MLIFYWHICARLATGLVLSLVIEPRPRGMGLFIASAGQDGSFVDLFFQVGSLIQKVLMQAMAAALEIATSPLSLHYMWKFILREQEKTRTKYKT